MELFSGFFCSLVGLYARTSSLQSHRPSSAVGDKDLNQELRNDLDCLHSISISDLFNFGVEQLKIKFACSDSIISFIRRYTSSPNLNGWHMSSTPLYVDNPCAPRVLSTNNPCESIHSSLKRAIGGCRSHFGFLKALLPHLCQRR